MPDNTLLNPGFGGDTVRDLARQGGSVKTQAVQLDLGGSSANAEMLITAGQQLMAASVPVVIASDQTGLTVSNLPNSAGMWGYFSGVSGTVVMLANQRVLRIVTSASATLAASFNVNGGSAIPVPISTLRAIEPRAALVGPTVVFTNTDSYLIEFVS